MHICEALFRLFRSPYALFCRKQIHHRPNELQTFLSITWILFLQLLLALSLSLFLSLLPFRQFRKAVRSLHIYTTVKSFKVTVGIRRYTGSACCFNGCSLLFSIVFLCLVVFLHTFTLHIHIRPSTLS